MPFEERQFHKFIKIQDGSICIDENPKEMDEIRELHAKGYVNVTTEKGKSFLRKKYTSLTAKIVGLSHQEKEWEGKTIKSWNIKIKDGEDIYILSVSEQSNNAITLLSALLNADLSQPVKIRPYSITNGDTKTTGVTLYQNDQKLKNFFFESVEVNGRWKKKYYNDFPAMPDDLLEEEEYKYHKAKQVKFLRNYIITNLIPKFNNDVAESIDNVDDNFDSIPATIPTDDDLPF